MDPQPADLADAEPTPPGPTDAEVAARRADIDAKQEQVASVLDAMGCEAALLFTPAHVGWFTGGLTVRGLGAEFERPGVYTNGRQRWLLCSAVDTQRLFDEDLDRLGFQVKEWGWDAGRADLIGSLTAGKAMAADRSYPHMTPILESLRPFLRSLTAHERDEFHKLGRVLAHALEATARAVRPGDTEEEIAGQVGHRLLRHGADPEALSVTADDRGGTYRRAGFTPAPVRHTCTIQATAHRGGLHATASRTVALGPPPDAFRAAFDLAARVMAVDLAHARPDETLSTVSAATARLLAETPHEFDGRLSQPGYGAGRYAAEELRRSGKDDPLADAQAVTWQARVGPAAVVDTVLVTPTGADVVTPVEDWPFKRAKVGDRVFRIPELLIKQG